MTVRRLRILGSAQSSLLGFGGDNGGGAAPSAPEEPSSEPNLWLDASSAAYFTYSSGTIPATWTSRDSSATVFTTASTGINHVIHAGLSGVLPSITFPDSGVHYFEGSYSYSSTNITVYVVTRPSLACMTSTNRRLLAFGVAGSDDVNNSLYFMMGKVTGNTTNFGSRRNSINTVFAAAADTNYVMTCEFNTSRVTYNGLTIGGSGVWSGACGITAVRIGNSLVAAPATGGGYRGQLGEVMVFHAIHDEATKAHNIMYLASKWGGITI